ncbi:MULTISPECIES: EscU/YscU/HrcU family type III secretion system export apparatus switch protein [Clostridia]|uniref:EscU/YscU/HrcU family type III secretion system export apparatus switch protein n=1 Tax=Clostridia TaxID=186801 RepID=UPI000EA03308|nr:MULTISPECIES: EscU/YscU/HrcU family type III secretion system export apparatus switch protein [Clostridia]NBJ68418.1 EscU/YscU/HrcU family type III secretion system export apparatus switch protein [Roseburia sp. 1XD42-34]RKI81179.1 EscU/YscU/HrcU family type III secretion system export apparatus switch protein [Clostridium sp. 1xD42-85]
MNQNQRKAAALRYHEAHHTAPVVTASGKGKLADDIIETAKENNIPILEDASLVELLAQLNINETIPEELYEAVAEVFAFIYRTDQQF